MSAEESLRSSGCIYCRDLTREWANPLALRGLGLAATEIQANSDFHLTAEVANITSLPHDTQIQQASGHLRGYLLMCLCLVL